ncbi:RNase A-like domain-containing protein [Amycolatopsis sp. lyj-84]|uniref:RNase A-like domain-containing protein n=1 Tax=Amycolatopsis sp. lyj-84 TaxID=2789284 RepID=UPI00397E470F
MRLKSSALAAVLAVSVLAGLIQPSATPAPHAKPAASSIASDSSEPSGPTDPQNEHYREWDGVTGLPDWGDPRFRQIVVDNAELAEDQEVREAASAALAAGGTEPLMAFLGVGLNEAKQRAAARKAEVARQDLAAVVPMRGTGGPYFNAEVERVLGGTDSDRRLFLAYGKDVAKYRDDQVTQDARTRADANRSRVQLLVGAGGPAVKVAAQRALDAGDAAITEFLANGYLVAAKADADAREQQIKDEEARTKAAEELSDLAQKAARAAQARRAILAAHGNGVKALERASNALVSAGTEARTAAQILAANKAGGQHPVSAFDNVKAEVARQLGYARQAATEAQQASATATVQANVLVEVGLTYGVQWARMAKAMADAANATVSASETAQHAIDSTAYTDQARNAQEEAERHAEEARQWRLHAEEHARAAAQIAEAARTQAEAAKDAAVRTKAARVVAEQAEARAWAAAERTRNARITAEREAEKAAAARATAERERANASAARGRAERHAATAHTARKEADRQAGIALGARKDAETQDGITADLETKAKDEEGRAVRARDRAYAAEAAQLAADARAAALESGAAAASGGAYQQPARDAANRARNDATTARTAATTARGQADIATGAAAGARAAATEATRAAARARAAAQAAAAAAARANAAANRAEAEADATHAAALQADAAAADATANEARAAEASRAATALAEQAASEALQSLMAADRTKAEADAAAAEAVSAATQANLAVRAATAARSSSQAITEPANAAITVATPFSGEDLAADFIVQVANQAKTVGAEQAQAARDRANEALAAAQAAADAATRASGEIKPAYDAAAAAAKSSADAARSAAEAQQAAADAAADGAAARAAGSRAAQADAQARADAVLARKAANAASNDARIAGRAASAAEGDAAAARSAATRAEGDALAARNAASAAEADATKAEEAAASAQQHADNVATSAKNALDASVEASKAADRAEEAQRLADQDARDRAAQEAADNRLPLPVGDASQEIDYGHGLVLHVDGETGIVYLNGVGLGKDSPELRRLIPILLRLLAEEGDGDKYFPVDYPYADPRTGIFYLLVDACGEESGLCNSNFEMQLMAMSLGGADPAGNEDPMAFVMLAAFADFAVSAGGRWGVKPPRGVPAGVPCNCFPAGTTVATDHGQVPIERIAVGDRVWARDLDTGLSELRGVVGLFSKHADEILTITTAGTFLRVTPEHPFWVVGRGWTTAGELRVGDRLSTLAGAEQPITGITRATGTTTVYNFEVEGDHNYYITDAQLLVHNCNLNYHEAAGGHAIKKHVGKTNSQLAARKIPRSSTFNDMPTAERVTQANLDANATAIASWKQGAAAGTFKRFSAPVSGDVGRIWVKDAQGVEKPKRVITELKRDASQPDGYIIWTSFLD